MKVALIHYRLIHFGGLETRLKNYIRFFTGRGDEVTVICARYSPEVQLPDGVKLVKLSPGLALKPYRQQAFSRKLGRYMKNHSFDISLSLGRTGHQQLVLCPGNHKGYLKALHKTTLSLSDRIQVKGDEEAFRNSRIILAASQMMATEVRDLYAIPESKIKVLYPPLNIEKFPAVKPGEKEQARAELQCREGYTYCVFASTGHGRKGLDLLLKTFEQLQDKKLILWIIGNPAVKTTLPNVHYLGYFNNPRNIYLAANFLVHPSVYEPYGQIVAEALQCQTPVIISDMTGAAEIVSGKEGIVLKNFNPDSWAQTLLSTKREDFDISPNFAQIKKLSLENHMQRMLEYAGIAK